jgi:hypothetical protein
MPSGDNGIVERGMSTRFSSTYQPKNKNRKKKGTKHFSTVYKDFLRVCFDVSMSKDEDLKAFLKEHSDIHNVSAKDIIVIRDIIAAMKGNDKAKDRIMNRTDGLPIQTVNSTGKQPLQIVFAPESEEDLKEADNFESNVSLKDSINEQPK